MDQWPSGSSAYVPPYEASDGVPEASIYPLIDGEASAPPDSTFSYVTDSSTGYSYHYTPSTYDGSMIEEDEAYAAEPGSTADPSWVECYDYIDIPTPHWKSKPGFVPSADYPGTVPADQEPLTTHDPNNLAPTPEPSTSDNTTIPTITTTTTNTNSITTGSTSYPCPMPNCAAGPFKRKADLERHHTQRHQLASQKQKFPCDYRRCDRRGSDVVDSPSPSSERGGGGGGGGGRPFYRKDHLRDHLRDYHREDLPRRGRMGAGSGGGGEAAAQAWRESRVVRPAWWRCERCLARIEVARDGFQCPRCMIQCDSGRRNIRGYK
ncbi:hypothetical protein F4778DRAFT_776258 [Xylariomycetidae sp. FL2044]|nr:hypothetical protein F4778DRAFT_776258 [Xylariomycetidae sp. FL2044]